MHIYMCIHAYETWKTKPTEKKKATIYTYGYRAMVGNVNTTRLLFLCSLQGRGGNKNCVNAHGALGHDMTVK